MFDISITNRSRYNSVVAFALTRVACCPLPSFLFFTFVRPKRLSRVQNDASLLARLSSFPAPSPPLPSVASSFVHRAEKTRALLVLLLDLPKASTTTIRPPPYLFPKWWSKRSSSSNRRRDVDATQLPRPPTRLLLRLWKITTRVGPHASTKSVVVVVVICNDDDDDDDTERRLQSRVIRLRGIKANCKSFRF